MNTDQKIQLALAILAGLSLVGNVAQAAWTRRRQQVDLDDRELKQCLRQLYQDLLRTNLFTMVPDHEVWHYGFPKLEVLSEHCAAAYAMTFNSRKLPTALADSIADAHRRIRDLRSFSDSWNTFSHGQLEPPAALQLRWPEYPIVVKKLEAISPVVGTLTRQLAEYLGD